MNPEQVRARAAWRAEAYWFLAVLFAKAPDAGSLAGMARIAHEHGDAEHEGDRMAKFLRDLSSAQDLDELAGRLAVEHARLFGGIRDGYGPTPPYESLWREGCLMGESTVAVAGAYRDAGYQPSGDWLPFDHLVEELRFAAALCHGEDAALLAGDDEAARWARDWQARFIAGRLREWVPHYCKALAEAAREPFFQVLARVTADALHEDASRLLEPAAA